MRPASEKQIAVELEKLRSIFGYEALAWKTAAGLYIDALSDLPYDLLCEAVQTCIRINDGYFPKPQQIRDLVEEAFEGRKAHIARVQREADKATGREEWPSWLVDIWGPSGRAERRQAMRDRDERYVRGEGWRATASEEPSELRRARPLGEVMRELQESLGIKASEPQSEPETAR